MPSRFRRFRLLMLAAMAGFLAVALAIRAIRVGALDSTGVLEQYSGTALYGSMCYVGLLAVWPRLRPLPTGVIALTWCWAMELFQLTGVPAELSDRSLLSRLVLGIQFDLIDVLWYPVGIAPLIALHHALRCRTPASNPTSS
ncbi:ribosomal maturation YjgA family protein [Asanoa iriomotensis]|nr:DUF2809 domain-containing protein [Asanoa iriomotensis]